MLWVALDGGAIGTITLNRGAGSIRPYVLETGLRFNHITVTRAGATVLSGGSFG
ncbi:MAG: hypothetical protein ACJ735_11985 [Actinomycetes bacterium]